VNTATVATVTPARILRAGARYLAKHGWVQGCYYDQTATVFTPAACLVGAIAMVCYGGPVETPAQHFDTPEFGDFEAAYALLCAYVVSTHGADDPYEFNDAKGRLLEEVLLVLHGAAEAWDAQHLRCPECGQRAVDKPPTWWGMFELLAVPEFSHVDGTPLCPVNGPDGDAPVLPVLVEGGA
jgi:hypothetical protein